MPDRGIGVAARSYRCQTERRSQPMKEKPAISELKAVTVSKGVIYLSQQSSQSGGHIAAVRKAGTQRVRDLVQAKSQREAAGKDGEFKAREILRVASCAPSEI